MPNTFLLGEVILAASSNMTLIFASIHLEQIVEWHTGPGSGSSRSWTSPLLSHFL